MIIINRHQTNGSKSKVWFLSIFVALLFVLFICISFADSCKKAEVNFFLKQQIHNAYLLPSLIGFTFSSLTLLSAKSCSNKGIKIFRNICWGVLSFFTLISFSLFSFISVKCDLNNLDESMHSSQLTLFYIAFAVCLFSISLSEEESNNSYNLNYLSFSNIYRVFRGARINNQNYSEFIQAFVSIIITFFISAIPFIMELAFGSLFADFPSFGSLVGLNDFYLIPAIFGASELSLLIIDRKEQSSNINLTKGKRIIVGALGIFTLMSFCLFAFGVNECVSADLIVKKVLYQAVCLSFVISTLIGVLKSLEYRERAI